MLCKLRRVPHPSLYFASTFYLPTLELIAWPMAVILVFSQAKLLSIHIIFQKDAQHLNINQAPNRCVHIVFVDKIPIELLFGASSYVY